MKRFCLSPSLGAQLALALLARCVCPQTRAKAEQEARSAGLTGAEIDAAWAGRSFDVKASAAITFALAVRSFSEIAIAASRSRALRMGLSPQELELVEARALELTMLEITAGSRPDFSAPSKAVH
ncbi:hypothetical protein ACN2C7_06365 [Caulobacter sp. ErkDOM-E]|jgi:hypothetical protein|uniref:hypothetical protein n=1 Tax=Caulobacter sp. ErkDOM-E TaxID=3402778 RepID=UPI003AF75F99